MIYKRGMIYMKKIGLEQFVVLEQPVGSRIVLSYQYLDEETGDFATQQRDNFINTDPEIQEHIKAIQDYIVDYIDKKINK